MRDASVLSLALLVGAGPGESALASQAGAFSGAQGANSSAADLSKLMSVLSMAAGGLYIAKGAQQLTCCSFGCDGAGAASRATKEAIDRKAAGSVMFREPVSRRFIEEARLCPPRPLLLSLFAPPSARAAGGACLDAMISLVTGGLMLLNGILGMRAAGQAGRNADALGASGTGMGSSYANGVASTGQGAGESAAASERGISSTGASMGDAQLVRIDPALLRTGKANDIMTQFEDQFGINRDKFANAVANGEDPRQLLGSAPKNPISNADMNKATGGAREMSGEQKDKATALAGSALGGAEAELMAKLGLGGGDTVVNPGASGTAASKARRRTFEDDPELESLSVEGEDASGMQLSPEVQAALAARDQDLRREGDSSLSLFEVVHRKYREKTKMIFGYDPDMPGTGGSDAQGN